MITTGTYIRPDSRLQRRVNEGGVDYEMGCGEGRIWKERE